jgi:hypothetical protein
VGNRSLPVNPVSLITLPLQIAIRATTTALRLAESAVEQVVRHVVPGDPEPAEEQPRAGQHAQPAAPPPKAQPAAPQPKAQTAAQPKPRSGAQPSQPRVAAPSPVPEPAVVSEEPVLVAESADPGAEDGAGPEIEVAEPWEGYRRAPAADVLARVASGSAAEVAVVQLYEQTHRRRKSVLDAAERRLTVLNDPARR